MLLEFGVKNFFSFNEGVSISFKLTPSCPSNISQGKSYTPILGIKGKNASGKTNVLKALSFLAKFCTNSFSSKPEQRLDIDSFYGSTENSEFYIEFEIKGLTYIYELAANQQYIEKEVLYRKDARKTKIIERIKNEFSEVIAEFDSVKQIKLRQNASFISTFKNYELENLKLLDEIYVFFNLIITNVNWAGLDMSKPSISTVSEYLKSNEDAFNFVKKIIKSCDTGIEDIDILIRDDEETNEKRYFPIFRHDTEFNRSITFYHESSGTQSLYLQLAKYQLVLKFGGVLALDEFDITFHPHILPLLLELFEKEETNPNNAQFIFSTHNTEIIDYLTKYRTYIVEKNENESFAFRLDEIPGDLIRNDRSIIPLYNSGKIGGIPKLK